MLLMKFLMSEAFQISDFQIKVTQPLIITVVVHYLGSVTLLRKTLLEVSLLEQVRDKHP